MVRNHASSLRQKTTGWAVGRPPRHEASKQIARTGILVGCCTAFNIELSAITHLTFTARLLPATRFSALLALRNLHARTRLRAHVTYVEGAEREALRGVIEVFDLFRHRDERE